MSEESNQDSISLSNADGPPATLSLVIVDSSKPTWEDCGPSSATPSPCSPMPQSKSSRSDSSNSLSRGDDEVAVVEGLLSPTAVKGQRRGDCVNEVMESFSSPLAHSMTPDPTRALLPKPVSISSVPSRSISSVPSRLPKPLMSSISPLATKEDLRNVCDEVKGMLAQFFQKLEKDDRLNSELVRKSHQLDVEHKTLQLKREANELAHNLEYTSLKRQMDFRHYNDMLSEHQRQRVENDAKIRLLQQRAQMRRNERCLTLACFSGKYNEAVALMDTPGININAFVLFHVPENHFEDGQDEESLDWWADWVTLRNSEDETAPFGEELTPIAAASQWYHSGNLAIVRQLVLRGADIEARGCWRGWRGVTPLILAVKTRGMDSMVAFLLASGASTKATSEDGNTALLSAVSCGQCSHAFQLLAASSDVCASNNFGYTALHYACLNRQAQLVDKLLEFSEVNVNALTSEGQSPLILASGSPMSAHGVVHPRDCIARLLAAKANVHIATKGDKVTALHKAAQYADLESCRLLLARGADLFAKDISGLTPFDQYASPLPAFALHYPPLEFLPGDTKGEHLALLLSFRHDFLSGPLLHVLRCGRFLPPPHVGPRGNWKCTKEQSARQRVFCNPNLVGLITGFL